MAFVGAIGQPDAHAGELPCAYVELIAGATATADDLMDYASKHVHERAAHPKYIELLDELPKTAVGKIFKPALRKRAIIRVYNEALSKAEIGLTVDSVIDSKKRGLVAQIGKVDGVSDADVTAVLGGFTRPWEWAE